MPVAARCRARPFSDWRGYLTNRNMFNECAASYDQPGCLINIPAVKQAVLNSAAA